MPDQPSDVAERLRSFAAPGWGPRLGGLLLLAVLVGLALVVLAPLAIVGVVFLVGVRAWLWARRRLTRESAGVPAHDAEGRRNVRVIGRAADDR